MDTHESRLEGPSEWVWIEVAHEEVDSGGAIKSKATMISELAKWSAGEHTFELFCQRSTAGDCCGQPWARHIAPPEELNHCLGCSAPAYEKALRCSWEFFLNRYAIQLLDQQRCQQGELTRAWQQAVDPWVAEVHPREVARQ